MSRNGLQWGRACLSAETGRSVDPIGQMLIASMGPRLFERGDAALVCANLQEMEKLQWGRACLSAETEGTCAPFVRPEELQWGRACLSAETVSSPMDRRPGCVLQWGRACLSAETPKPIFKMRSKLFASMGPRLFERGDEVTSGAHAFMQGKASMGPRLFERGDLREANR